MFIEISLEVELFFEREELDFEEVPVFRG